MGKTTKQRSPPEEVAGGPDAIRAPRWKKFGKNYLIARYTATAAVRRVVPRQNHISVF